ncbi:MAG: POTRA domain-containing protein, partial [Bacteroidales bacterium]
MSKTYNRLYFIGGKGRSFIHFFYKLSLFIFLSNIIISSVPAQENYIVRGVKFTGNESLGKDYLIENLAIKEVSYFEQLLTSNEPFLYHRDLVQLDVERLKTIYQSEGFLGITAKLDQAEINNKRETVKVTFNIEEGEPVRVDSVFFKFTDSENSSFNNSLSELIIEELELVPGKRFRDKSLDIDVETITTFLQNLGYAYATVNYDLRVKPNELLTEIEYSISKGPLCQFGETQIAGNDYYSEDYILKQLTYQEGEQYSKSELKESRQYLYDLQVFRVVSIVPQRNTQTQQNPIPVKIYIEEAPRLSTRFGVGYGTEDKFRAFLDLNHLGLFGQARRINLFLKHSALEPYSASLKWIQPRFLTPNSSITLNPFIHKKSEPGYETRTFGINIPLRYEHNDLWSSSV